MEAVSSLDKGKAKELWVYSVRDNRANPTLCLVTVAGWETPMSLWKTACGWPFAQNRAESAFCYKVDITKKKCRKCINHRKGHDPVNVVEVRRLKVEGVAEAMLGMNDPSWPSS